MERLDRRYQPDAQVRVLRAAYLLESRGGWGCLGVGGALGLGRLCVFKGSFGAWARSGNAPRLLSPCLATLPLLAPSCSRPWPSSPCPSSPLLALAPCPSLPALTPLTWSRSPSPAHPRSNNQLRGPLPASWELLRQLVFLDLRNNQLSGGLAGSWSRLSRLSLLALSNNSLQGTLPAPWSTLGVPSDSSSRGLGTLRLERNQISGTLPPAWSALTLLSQIELGNNRLNGTIPLQYSTLGPSTWRPLNYLNLSANALSGSLPVAFSALTAISSLDLQGNRLTGPLPSLWSRLVTATYLDLSDNRCGQGRRLGWVGEGGARRGGGGEGVAGSPSVVRSEEGVSSVCSCLAQAVN